MHPVHYPYSGSHCSWATSVTPTLESDKECIGTPDTPVPSRVRLGGPMSLHTAIENRGREIDPTLAKPYELAVLLFLPVLRR